MPDNTLFDLDQYEQSTPPKETIRYVLVYIPQDGKKYYLRKWRPKHKMDLRRWESLPEGNFGRKLPRRYKTRGAAVAARNRFNRQYGEEYGVQAFIEMWSE